MLPEKLAAQLAKFDPLSVERALDRAVQAAHAEFAGGLNAYRRHDYRRAPEVAEVVWESGGARLLDHGGDGVPTLFVPSLINRGWILDLAPGRGMMSWLTTHGVHPYRIEWGPPGEAERRFDIADYIRQRLEPAIDETAARSGKLILAGYCMGGLLALAAALRRPDAIAGLVLLASPWDFHAAGVERPEALAAIYRSMRPWLAGLGELPVDLIQAFFAMHDPIIALRKFRRFAGLDQASPAAQAFVALEDWLNHGIPLTLPVADDAFVHWYADNAPARALWQMDGCVIDPMSLAMKTLVVIPGTDRIVPPASAAAILPRLQRAQRLDPALGHIGMVVGRGAETALWRPLADWICA